MYTLRYKDEIKPTYQSIFPEIGKVYYAYNDGKIKISREMEIIVTDIIDIDKLSIEEKVLWKRSIDEYYWLYDRECTEFIVGYYSQHKFIFARTQHNSWFSFNQDLLDAELDVTGELHKIAHNYI